MNWIATGASLMALGVALGAFGAHGLRNRLEPAMLEVYHTAVLYHLLHAIGILLVAVLARAGAVSAAGEARVCWLLLLGTLLFSGSLYALSVTGIRLLGAITPLGGIAFLAGWVLLAVEAFRGRPA